MLYASLLFSAFLLLAANLLASGKGHLGRKVVGAVLMVLAVPFVLSGKFPPVLLLGLLLAVVGAVTAGLGPTLGRFAFLRLSLLATVIVYGGIGLTVAQGLARLRALNPYESMEGQIATPGPATRGTPPAAVAPRLARWEELFEHYSRYELEAIHENWTQLFVNSPGFGVTRGNRLPALRLARRQDREPVPPQPGPRADPVWSPGEWERLPAGEEPPLTKMFEESVADFVNPRGFGFVKDRRHVAGFESHRFSQLPAAARRWTVQTLDLVSLLLHEEPAVYVSDHLPRMDQARGMPTRPLDNFEASGLAAVRAGDDPFISRSGGVVRMLGGVRSVRQCVACHGGERGDLLGAFSYTIRLAAQ